LRRATGTIIIVWHIFLQRERGHIVFGQWVDQLLGLLGLGKKQPTAPARKTGASSTPSKHTADEASFDSILDESGLDPTAADGSGAKTARGKGKTVEKIWKPAPPEFTDLERRNILASDEAAVRALSSTIMSELQASMDKIPPFPVIANKLIEALEANNVRTDLVERLITQDAAIAAKILSTANSPFYNSPTTIETLPHAIRVIGLTEVSRVAVAAATAAIFDAEERMAHEAVSHQQQMVWRHSIATARGSAWLALHLSQDVQRAYVAGLLHDVGKAVALRGLGLAVLNGRLRDIPTVPVIYAAIEDAHVDVGAMVAKAWALAEHLGAVVQQHHATDHNDSLVRLVSLVSSIDELRTNPAHRSGLLGQVRSLAEGLRVSEAQLLELELELKKAAAAAGKL
jgi:putative nucleotidyltransferase with HDIG domain